MSQVEMYRTIVAVLLDAAPYISTLVRHDQPGHTRAKLCFFKGLLHCHGIGLCIGTARSEPLLPLQTTPVISQFTESYSDRANTSPCELNRVVDEIRLVVGLFQWPQQSTRSEPHQRTSYCRPSHHGGGNRATMTQANTTSNAFGVERSDSSTLVTSRIASATHQTGQWHPLDTPLSSSWLVPVRELARSDGSRRTERPPPPRSVAG